MQDMRTEVGACFRSPGKRRPGRILVLTFVQRFIASGFAVFIVHLGLASPAMSQPPPNIRVNNPTGDLPRETQSNVVVAAYEEFVVTAFNDSKGNGGIGFAYSTDWGQSFVDGGGLPVPAGGDVWLHPSLVVDSEGNFFLCGGYQLPGESTNSVAVWRGVFVGSEVFCEDPVVVIASKTTSPAILRQRPYIAIDPQNDERLYVAYVEIVFGPPTIQTLPQTRIAVSRSLDHGETWEAAAVSGTTSGLDQPRPVVNSDGSLCVFWENVPVVVDCDFRSSEGSIEMLRNDNPSATPFVFTGAPITVGRTAANWTSWWGGNKDPIASLGLSVAVDERTGALYCVWNGADHWIPESDLETTINEVEGVTPNGNDNPTDEDVKTLTVQTQQPQAQDVGLGELTTGDIDYWRLDAQPETWVLVRLEPKGWECDLGEKASTTMRLELIKQGVANLDTVLAISEIPSFVGQVAFFMPENSSPGSIGNYFLRVSGFPGTYRLVTRKIRSDLDPLRTSVSRDARDIELAWSVDRGDTWSPAQVVNTESLQQSRIADNRHPAITVDGNGSVHVFWYSDLPYTNASAIVQHYYHAMAQGVSGSPQQLSFSGPEPVSNAPMYFDVEESRLDLNYGFYNSAAPARGFPTRVYCGFADHRVDDVNYPGDTDDPDAYIASVAGRIPTDVQAADVPGILIMQNAPNPFNPITRIGFQVFATAPVSLDVYDSLGRHVRTIVRDAEYPPGRHEVLWDGTDASGHQVSSGVYFAKLTAGRETRGRKLVLTK